MVLNRTCDERLLMAAFAFRDDLGMVGLLLLVTGNAEFVVGILLLALIFAGADFVFGVHMAFGTFLLVHFALHLMVTANAVLLRFECFDMGSMVEFYR